MSAKKDRDAKTMKKTLQMLGERDESIRQAFTQFDKKVGQGFGALELKVMVIFEALKSMGITEEKLQEIATVIQQSQQGGNPNEQNRTPTTESVETPTDTEATRDENGDEHFG